MDAVEQAEQSLMDLIRTTGVPKGHPYRDALTALRRGIMLEARTERAAGPRARIKGDASPGLPMDAEDGS